MSNAKLSYELVENALMDADAITDPSEAHGTLCGMICVSGKITPENWLSHILGDYDAQDLNIKSAISLLADVHNEALKDLTEQNYELDILIHDDDTPLDIRIDDLGHWCQGFLYGLSLSGLKDIKKLPQDASEVLQDMIDISKAGYNSEDDENENEEAFAEIFEYIRIGAYVVYNTLNVDTPSTTSTITFH